MNIFPITDLARLLPSMEITADLDSETAMLCMQALGTFNGSTMGVVSFSGQTAWECHPGGDELLYYLEGEAEICLVTEAGDIRRTVRKGDVAQVPKGQWHSQRTFSPVRLFFVTPADGSMHASKLPI